MDPPVGLVRTVTEGNGPECSSFIAGRRGGCSE